MRRARVVPSAGVEALMRRRADVEPVLRDFDKYSKDLRAATTDERATRGVSEDFSGGVSTNLNRVSYVRQ